MEEENQVTALFGFGQYAPGRATRRRSAIPNMGQVHAVVTADAHNGPIRKAMHGPLLGNAAMAYLLEQQDKDDAERLRVSAELTALRGRRRNVGELTPADLDACASKDEAIRAILFAVYDVMVHGSSQQIQSTCE